MIKRAVIIKLIIFTHETVYCEKKRELYRFSIFKKVLKKSIKVPYPFSTLVLMADDLGLN